MARNRNHDPSLMIGVAVDSTDELAIMLDSASEERPRQRVAHTDAVPLVAFRRPEPRAVPAACDPDLRDPSCEQVVDRVPEGYLLGAHLLGGDRGADSARG
jgi:hypothetical protein